METERTQGLLQGNGKLLNGGKLSTGQDENTLRVNGGDGHTTVWISLIPEKCIFNIG
jgi:hypothetical protein